MFENLLWSLKELLWSFRRWVATTRRGYIRILARAQQVSTIEGARNICRVAPHGSQASELALAKWKILIRKKAQQASNFQEAKEALDETEPGETRKLAEKKLVEFASTIEEARYAYRNVLTQVGGSDIEIMAWEKWHALALKKAQLATTLREAEQALLAAPEESEAKRLASEKIRNLI